MERLTRKLKKGGYSANRHPAAQIDERLSQLKGVHKQWVGDVSDMITGMKQSEAAGQAGALTLAMLQASYAAIVRIGRRFEDVCPAEGNTDDAGEMLAAFGFEGDTLSELVDNAVEKAQQAGETLLSAVVSTALKSAAYAVVYVVSFLLLLLLLRLVLTPLHLFTKLPVVHGVNALLGGVLGLVKCALLLFLAVWVLQKLQLLVTPELVNKTVLLKFFAQNSPIDLIAKL